MEPPCLQAALEYLALGWCPIPLTSPSALDDRAGKRPLYGNWQNSRLTADELRAAWATRPNANVGILLGEPSGLVGLDIDSDRGHELVLSWFGGTLPKTPTFKTAHGGLRLLFRLPPGLQIATKSIGDSLGEDVRILGTGSQTVMPPSIYIDADGNDLAYYWRRGLDLHCETLPWQNRTAAELEAAAAAPRSSMSQYERAVLYARRCSTSSPAISGQDGHKTLFRVACHLADTHRLNPEQLRQVLTEVYNTRCKPPWSDKEIGHKIESVFSRPKGEKARPKEAEQPEEAVEIVSGEDFLKKELPPVRWIVPSLLPAGGFLLAGKPKDGKSLLALQTALAVAKGEKVLGAFEVEEPAETLYLGLEDGDYLIQERLRSFSHGTAPGLYLATKFPSLKKGARGKIEKWLDQHPRAGLVIIDTYAMLRDATKEEQYVDAYRPIHELGEIGKQRNVCILTIWHTKKGGKKGEEAENIFDTILGSTGMAGAADVLAVLARPQDSFKAKLHIKGRAGPPKTWHLQLNEEDVVWRITEAVTNRAAQMECLLALVKLDKPALSGTVQKVVEQFPPRYNENGDKASRTPGAIYQALGRARTEGLVSVTKVGGKMYYALTERGKRVVSEWKPQV